MGGGNGQKSKMARERNMEKMKNAAKGSQLETNKKAMTIQAVGSDKNRILLAHSPGQSIVVARFKAPNGRRRNCLKRKKSLRCSCKVCMQTFICTTSEVKCKEHAEAKHPKSDLFACFPHLKK